MRETGEKMREHTEQTRRRFGCAGRFGRIAIGLLLVVLVGVAALLLVPVSTANLATQPDPAPTYREALARVEQLKEQERPLLEQNILNPVCQTRLLAHGEPTAAVVVFLHGLTACPAQFVPLGEQLHAQGYTVFIPRLPQHGYRDRLTPQLAQLRATAMVARTDDSVDIAHGLGEQVIVVGFSAGGVLSSWVAQFRPDVDRTLVVSPAFSTGSLPAGMETIGMRLLLRLPNQFLWKDKAAQEAWAGPPHAYPWNSTRSFGEVMRVGAVVRRAASQQPPATGELVVLTNAADEVVDNALTEQVIADWRASGYSALTTYTFPAEHGLIHDMIDPTQPEQQTGVVYPVLLELLTGEPNGAADEAGAADE